MDEATRRARAKRRRHIQTVVKRLLEELVAEERAPGDQQDEAEPRTFHARLERVVRSAFPDRKQTLVRDLDWAFNALISQAGIEALYAQYRAAERTHRGHRAEWQRWLEFSRSLPLDTSERQKAKAIAERFGAEPETVRYRLRQLRRKQEKS